MKKVKGGETGKDAIERETEKQATDPLEVGLFDIVKLLQGNIEILARRACRLYDLRRELLTDHRDGFLAESGMPGEGTFRDRQIEVLEETERFRENLCRLGAPYPQREDALRLLIAAIPKECHPEAPNPLWAIAEIMFTWTKLSHLCRDLDALPPIAISADAPDFVAAGTAQIVPSEERIDQILATGTRCIALLKDFFAFREAEARDV